MSYTCECLSGYEQDNETGLCIDINECVIGTWASLPSQSTSLPCPTRSQCFNLNGNLNLFSFYFFSFSPFLWMEKYLLFNVLQTLS